MTLFHIFRSSVLAIALGGAASSAFASAAVASGDGNFTYTVTEATSLEEAKASALEECGKQTTNCKLLVWTSSAGAIALAKGDGGLNGQIDADPAQARAKALRECSKAYRNCKFSAMYWEPGGRWAAFAYAKDDKGVLAGVYFAYDMENQDKARKIAVDGCIKQQQGHRPYECKVSTVYGDASYVQVGWGSGSSFQARTTLADAIARAMADCKSDAKPGETCKLMDKATNTGSRTAPASFARVASQSEKARADARPASPQVATRAVQHLSCTNRCVNGSCVRTFADGRTEQWQAPRIFDPFTNDWKWDTNSCGG